MFVWFYGISTFVGYLMPNLFSYKLTVLFQTIKFSISTVSKETTIQNIDINVKYMQFTYVYAQKDLM